MGSNPGYLLKYFLLYQDYGNPKNCSSDREKLLKFEAEGREFAKILRSGYNGACTIETRVFTVKIKHPQSTPK